MLTGSSSLSEPSGPGRWSPIRSPRPLQELYWKQKSLSSTFRNTQKPKITDNVANAGFCWPLNCDMIKLNSNNDRLLKRLCGVCCPLLGLIRTDYTAQTHDVLKSYWKPAAHLGLLFLLCLAEFCPSLSPSWCLNRQQITNWYQNDQKK